MQVLRTTTDHATSLDVQLRFRRLQLQRPSKTMHSCVYADEFYDCDGNCLNDTDGDGVCDELEINGCTDSTACNYDASYR